jgi:serine/threonine protein phosphatase PrpC
VISVVPQIVSFNLDSSWDFIVVATDGVWDAMTNRELINFVREKLGVPGSPSDGRRQGRTRTAV